MRVLSIATTHPRWSGDSEPCFVHDLNRHLVARGHQVTAVVPHAAGAAPREQLDGVEVRRFRYFAPATAQRLFYDGGALPNLRARPLARLNLVPALTALAAHLQRLLRARTYDLVHCHWLIPQGLMVAGLLARRETPWVVTAHAGDVFATHPAFVAANRLVLRRAPLTTVNSTLTLARVKTLDPAASARIIPMGVDLAAFSPEHRDTETRARLGGGRPQVLFGGRLAEKKGVEFLVQAWPRVLAEQPDARLAILGSGPSEARIRGLVDQLELQGSVKLLGAVGREAMAAAMASADLFVAPSIVDRSGDTEGLGVVLLEALASGTPVVASAVGGIVDIVEHEATGLLAREQDPADLAAQCLRMLSDPGLAEATVAEGCKRIQDRFSWPAIAERFEQAFVEVRAGAGLGGAVR